MSLRQFERRAWILLISAGLVLVPMFAGAKTHDRDAQDELAPGAAGSTAGVALDGVSRITPDAENVSRLFELANQRLALMPAVAAAKWQARAAISDPAREEAVIRRAQELGAPMGLAGEPLRRLFELQIGLARSVQSGLYERWQSHGFDYSGSVAPLSALRPRLDEWTAAFLRAVYMAAPALHHADFSARYAVQAEQQLNSDGWNEGARKEMLEALAGVREVPAPALQRIAASGVLRIGTTGDYAPFSLESDGTVGGSDIELAKELARELHARPVFVRTSWASMLDNLDNDEFDLSLGGVTVTAARKARAAFSTPYASGGKTILARCTDAQTYRGLSDVDSPRVRVIVNPGGTNEQYVRTNLHRAQIVVYPDNRAIFGEIVSGHADVMITDDVEADLQTRRHRALCRTYPGTLTHADKAILLPRDADLISAVNAWLAAALAAGEPARVLKSYLER